MFFGRHRKTSVLFVIGLRSRPVSAGSRQSDAAILVVCYCCTGKH